MNTTKALATGCLAIMSVVMVSGQTAVPARQTATAPASQAPGMTDQRAALDKYCVACHNAKVNTANLKLDQLDLARLGEQGAVAEKVVRKLRAGMMPPAGMPRPEPAAREALITWLENELDRTATPHLPPPGLHDSARQSPDTHPQRSCAPRA